MMQWLCLFCKKYKDHNPLCLHSLIQKHFKSSSFKTTFKKATLKATKETPLFRVKHGYF